MQIASSYFLKENLVAALGEDQAVRDPATGEMTWRQSGERTITENGQPVQATASITVTLESSRRVTIEWEIQDGGGSSMFSTTIPSVGFSQGALLVSSLIAMFLGGLFGLILLRIYRRLRAPRKPSELVAS